MFFPEAMTRVRLIIPARDLLAVTKELARQGIMHPIDGSQLVPAKVQATGNSWAENAAAYASLERRIQGIMQTVGLEEKPVSTDGESGLVPFDEVRPSVEQMEREVSQSTEQRERVQKRLEQMHAVFEQVEPLAGIDISMTALRNPRYTYSILGIIPTANIDRLRTSLERIPFVLQNLRQEEDRTVVLLTGLKRNADILERAARSAYLNPLNLPETFAGTPGEYIASLQREMEEARKEIAQIERDLSRLRDERGEQLQKLLWRVRSSRILAEAIARFGRLRYTYVIEGWVPSAKLDDFSRRMKRVAHQIVIDTFSFKRGTEKQNVPVALKNPWFIRPFQQLVTNYSQPNYDEIDPTFILAITFPLIFGAMFGDVGQGILLAALGSLLASGRIKALRGLATLGGVIVACGLAATLFGFFYGSIFGFEDILPALLLQPMHNVFQIMALGVGFGFVSISIGYLVAILNHWTSRNWGRLLFDAHGVAGLVLYWSLVALAVEVIAGIHPVPLILLAFSALIGAIGVMFSEALEHLVSGHRPVVEGGIGIYVVGSFFELFENLISLLSNSISHIRVAAFAVAHVGLSAVFFILANLVSSSHGAGYWLILVIGNLFIVGFEGVIVSIQTMRLEYYEFFSKFFTGGGMKYEPLTLQPTAED